MLDKFNLCLCYAYRIKKSSHGVKVIVVLWELHDLIQRRCHTRCQEHFHFHSIFQGLTLLQSKSSRVPGVRLVGRSANNGERKMSGGVCPLGIFSTPFATPVNPEFRAVSQLTERLEQA